MGIPRTLLDKIWDGHIVHTESGAPPVIYIDLHLVHEVTSPQAFTGLKNRGLAVRRPDRTVATMDHSIPTNSSVLPLTDKLAAAQLAQLKANCETHGIPLYEMGSDQQGIVHVIGPELGMTRPGMTIVCGDSHTSTHGAFGALAFGIGTSEVEHVLATQCLLQEKPGSYAIQIDGKLSPGVTAKDIILALIAEIGTDEGRGFTFEYGGSAIRALGMEARMTICNMSIEAGARAGMMAPDETTFEYLAGREFAPQGPAWDRALEAWRTLPSDPDVVYDRTLNFNAGDLAPMVTYGTNPGMGVKIDEPVPDPDQLPVYSERQALQKALAYMDLKPGQPLLGHPVDVVFIGSCTNARISDLRAAAQVMKGRRVASGVRMLVVPGSQKVKNSGRSRRVG